MLKEFGSEFENIYGPGAVTMNLHLLNHYENVIFNCGPLWSYSMFGFENNIGVLKNFVCGNSDVLSQIATKYAILRNSEANSDFEDKHKFQCSIAVYQKKTISIKSEHRPILESAKAIEESQESLLIWTRIRLNGHIFTSTCAIETKSVDFFIQTTDKTMGKICFFFGSPLEPKILLQSYENQYQNYHWTEIQQTEIFKIFSCNEIEEKLLYFKAGRIEYVTKEPNVYGRGQ